MRPLLTLLAALTLLAPTALHAAEPTLLWVVEDKPKDGRVFLLGSIHMGKAEAYPLDPTIEQAFEMSDGLAVEVDVTELTAQDSMRFLAAMMLPEGERLSPLLTEEEWSQLVGALAPMGLPTDAVDAMRPWATATLLVELQATNGGYATEQGIDQYFLGRAHADSDMEVVALETVESQLGVFEAMSQETQLLMLRQSLGEDALAIIDDIWTRWAAGDADGLHDNLVAPDPADGESGVELHQLMFDDRHPGMVSRIDELLHSGGTWFVVVGAGHVVGEGGLSAMLERQGLRVQQLDQGGLPKQLKKKKKKKKRKKKAPKKKAA